MGAGQVVVRQTCSQLRLTRCSPGLTAVRLAPPAGELARRPQGGETERGTQAQLTERASYASILPPAGRMGQRGLLSAVFGKETHSFLHPAPPTIATESTISTVSRYPPKTTKPTISTKSRFHGTPRKARFQRNQRNHDFTAPQRNHESNETHEKNETPGKKAFRCFRCIWVNRDFVGNVAGRITPVSASGTRGGSSRKSGGTAGKSCWGCRSRSRRRSGRCCRPGGPAGRRRPA